ncbi:hypothetical protein K491DRAFT_687487 [Lophiostoma macrostomum CBS 122681]|uniref:CFEM domain-containing protein n=1 Tax=Lophiostoma macrostomum CBS 122681 TaxID=1314788 RepID=A0A6A6TRS8_9PLEO|nr:hypothetical protein K491DRAFT_687487 [Lophiostoma macrostomum CBS 122681]
MGLCVLKNVCIFGDALTSSGCLATDGKCLCENKTYMEAAYCCIKASCSASDEKSSFSTAEYVCSTWGVNYDASASVSCPSSTSTATASTTTSTSTNTNTDSSDSDSTSHSTTPKKKSGLSTAAKGGIGAGAGALALALLAALGWYLKKRRASSNGGTAATSNPPTSDISQAQVAPVDPGKFPVQVGVTQVVPPYHQQQQQQQQQQPQQPMTYMSQPYTPPQPELQGSAMAPVATQPGVFAGSELQGGYVQRPHELGSA